jgi:hypothetical protein
MPLNPEELALLQEALSELESQFRDLKEHPTVSAKYMRIMALWRRVVNAQ